MRKLIFMMMLVSALGVSAVSRITSPSGELLLNVDIDADGSLCYSLDYKGSSLVKESRLGLVSDEADFTHGFKIAGTDTLSVDRTWKPIWGEYETVRDNFRELAVILKAEKPDREMTVRFRLFDDGLGFRYEFPAQRGSSNYLTVRDEKTEFNFTGDHTLFCIPGDYDTDEYLWSETSFSGLPDALGRYRRHSEAQGR